MTDHAQILSALGRGIKRSFNVQGKNSEKGAFPNKPPRSMTEEERKYYAKHKHLNGLYNS